MKTGSPQNAQRKEVPVPIPASEDEMQITEHRSGERSQGQASPNSQRPQEEHQGFRIPQIHEARRNLFRPREVEEPHPVGRRALPEQELSRSSLSSPAGIVSERSRPPPPSTHPTLALGICTLACEPAQNHILRGACGFHGTSWDDQQKQEPPAGVLWLPGYSGNTQVPHKRPLLWWDMLC